MITSSPERIFQIPEFCEDKCDYIKEYLAKYSIEAEVVGEVNDSNSLVLNYQDQQVEVFNQEKNPVFIFR